MILGSIETPAGPVPVVATKLTLKDHLGVWKVRSNIGRMDYRMDPGLYAVGAPDQDSVVLVSANYKLSFDYLRRELAGINAWILVLDTKGINVWCAAGKGTFGTDEIVRRVQDVHLDKVVKHTQLIVPQLGAPGVAAHTVKKETGFTVIYGPVRAADISAFLAAGKKATLEMRQVRFTFNDRAALVGVEVAGALKYLVLATAVLILLSGLGTGGYATTRALERGMRLTLFLLTGFLGGAVFSPLLLPFIPGRAFAWKGVYMGLVLAVVPHLVVPAYRQGLVIEQITGYLLSGTIASFLAMNFTGASTYTSLSGVLKEMKIAIPLQIVGLVTGMVLIITGGFTG